MPRKHYKLEVAAIRFKRLKDLEAENARVRRAVSDQTLDRMILAELSEN